MKKYKRILLIVAVCCMIIGVTGCGSKASTSSEEGNETTVSKPSENETTQERIEGTESAKVTAIYQGNDGNEIREEFDFDEKDEHFSADRRWILDLNGNNIIIDDLIKVKGEVIVTNGTIIPKISDMLSLDMNASFTLGKTEYGEITVCCYEGFNGIKTVNGFYVDEAVFDVYGGVGIREEYIDYGGAADYEKLTTMNVYGGIGVYVVEGERGYCWDGLRINVFENGVGVENHGNSGLGYITVKGGVGVVNLANCVYTGEKIYVESGLGVHNQGKCELGNGIAVKSGMAVKNEGRLSIEFLTTIPGEMYSDTLIYNDVAGEISGVGICIVTGKNATGIDNHGTICGSVSLSAGIPTVSELGFGAWNYEYRDYLKPYIDYLNAGQNAITDTVMCLNGEDGIIDAIEGAYMQFTVSINATEDVDVPYSESVVGLLNKSNKSNDLYYTNVYMSGRGGFGIVNCANSLFTSLDDNAYVRIFDTDIEYGGDNAHNGEKTIGFLNEGKMRVSKIVCNLYGNKNIGLMNSGDIIQSLQYGGTEFELQGTENKALVNSGSYSSTGIQSFAKGESGTIIVNSGSLTVTQNRLYTETLGHKNTGVNNSGIIMADEMVVGGRDAYGYGADDSIGMHNSNVVECNNLVVYSSYISKGTGIINDTNGNIKVGSARIYVGNEYVDDGGSRNNTGVSNHGVMTINEHYETLIGSSSSTGLFNDGDFRCGSIRITALADVSGSAMYDNAGSITVSGNLNIAFHKGCQSTWRKNGGSVAVLGDWYAICHLDENNNEYELYTK